MRMRRPVAFLLACCVALGLAACTPGGSGKAPNRHFKPRPTTGLGRYLENPPTYSVPGVRMWDKDYTPSTAELVDHLYAPSVRARATKALTTQGLAEIAHIFWITDERVQSDLVLLRFATPAGASARVRDLESAANGDDTLRSYSIDSRGAPIVYYAKEPDSQGNTAVRAYAQIDDLVVEMFVFSQSGLPKILVQRWLTTQVGMLP